MFIYYAILLKKLNYLPKYYSITHEKFIKLQWRMRTKADFNQRTNNSSKPRKTLSTLYFVATTWVAYLNTGIFAPKQAENISQGQGQLNGKFEQNPGNICQFQEA